MLKKVEHPAAARPALSWKLHGPGGCGACAADVDRQQLGDCCTLWPGPGDGGGGSNGTRPAGPGPGRPAGMRLTHMGDVQDHGEAFSPLGHSLNRPEVRRLKPYTLHPTPYTLHPNLSPKP